MQEKDFGQSQRQYEQGRIQYRLALELVKNRGFGKVVLDIGAGKGEFADILSERGYKVSCVDGTKELCKELEEKGYETACIDLEEERLPFPDNSFDLVVSLEVIEHLWNTEHYLKELWRVLRPDGYVILTTPNYNFWSFRILSFLGLAERFLTQDYHKKLFTAHSLSKRLGPYFTVEKIAGRGMVPKLGLHYPAPVFRNLLAMHIGVLCKPKK
ncbi:MAG: class I SAM-dependent methyltransferase [Candidatus Colwellbacteria bacterium]|nr:class I SAM-dependent methyltransferase [Candidatus Colwellbacteria bacterium]